MTARFVALFRAIKCHHLNNSEVNETGEEAHTYLSTTVVGSAMTREPMALKIVGAASCMTSPVLYWNSLIHNSVKPSVKTFIVVKILVVSISLLLSRLLLLSSDVNLAISRDLSQRMFPDTVICTYCVLDLEILLQVVANNIFSLYIGLWLVAMLLLPLI
jgi:hypothetical protein